MDANFLATPLNELELSRRVYNVLKSAFGGDALIRDIVVKTEADMMRLPNFGRTSFKELKEVLAQCGLQFGMAAETLPGYKPPHMVEFRLAIVDGPTRAQLTKQVLELTAGTKRGYQTEWPVKDPFGFINTTCGFPMSRDHVEAVAQAICTEESEISPIRLTAKKENAEVVLEYELKTRTGSIVIRGEIPGWF